MIRTFSTTLALGLVAAIALPGFSSGGGARKDKIVCNPDFEVSAARTAPRRCTILPPGASFGEGANLARLRWRGTFGGRQARFTGIERGFHLPYQHVRVHGRAYRLRNDRCGGDLKLYTRLFVKSRFGHTTVKPQNCFGND